MHSRRVENCCSRLAYCLSAVLAVDKNYTNMASGITNREATLSIMAWPRCCPITKFLSRLFMSSSRFLIPVFPWAACPRMPSIYLKSVIYKFMPYISSNVEPFPLNHVLHSFTPSFCFHTKVIFRNCWLIPIYEVLFQLINNYITVKKKIISYSVMNTFFLLSNDQPVKIL